MRLSLRHSGLAPPDPNRKDYALIDSGREVGRITRFDTPADMCCYWSITVIGAHQAGIRTNGRATTLEEAKAQFETNYRRWLAWAKLEVES
jgi:hypothetical protein